MRRLWWAVVIAALAVGLAAAQMLPWQARTKRPQDVTYLYPEQITVPAGREAVIELHFRVNPGMHINSHDPLQKELIATRLMVPDTSGLELSKVEFPTGSEYALAAMPSEKLSVYTGEFVLKAHVRATAGQHLLQGLLRYQACDTNSCYPPRNAPVAVDVIAK